MNVHPQQCSKQNSLEDSFLVVSNGLLVYFLQKKKKILQINEVRKTQWSLACKQCPGCCKLQHWHGCIFANLYKSFVTVWCMSTCNLYTFFQDTLYIYISILLQKMYLISHSTIKLCLRKLQKPKLSKNRKYIQGNLPGLLFEENNAVFH